VTKIWLSCFDRAELAMTTDDLVGLFWKSRPLCIFQVPLFVLCITVVVSPPPAGRWHSLSTGQPSHKICHPFHRNLAFFQQRGIKANHYIYIINYS
jgi:hypothetical protein